MRKHKVLLVSLLNLLIIPVVPGITTAAFDAPDPNPISFSLANLVSFRDVLVPNYVFQKGWIVSTGGARLFGMPEIQPVGVQVSAPGFMGRWRFSGSGLNVGAYNEFSSGLGYERKLSSTLSAELEIQLLHVSIEGYGNAWSYFLNARTCWLVQPGVKLAVAWLNATRATMGTNHYPLPCKVAVGGHLKPLKNLQLFLELEQDTRYTPTSRFGLGWQAYYPLTFLWDCPFWLDQIALRLPTNTIPISEFPNATD